MKKGYLPPIAVLTAILAFAVWNSRTMTADTDRWRAQLRQTNVLAQTGDWSGAAGLLVDSYEDWSARQTYLHIVSEHDAVDDAEAMYHRALAFAATQEPSEFQAELSDLQDQLRLLAEMERFSVRNIL